MKSQASRPVPYAGKKDRSTSRAYLTLLLIGFLCLTAKGIDRVGEGSDPAAAGNEEEESEAGASENAMDDPTASLTRRLAHRPHGTAHWPCFFVLAFQPDRRGVIAGCG